jgi:hypothetical protein
MPGIIICCIILIVNLAAVIITVPPFSTDLTAGMVMSLGIAACVFASCIFGLMFFTLAATKTDCNLCGIQIINDVAGIPPDSYIYTDDPIADAVAIDTKLFAMIAEIKKREVSQMACCQKHRIVEERLNHKRAN